MGNEFIKNIKYIFESVIEVLYPRSNSCPLCDSYIEEDELLCRNCISRIKFCKGTYKINRMHQQFTYFSMAYYSDAVMELIVRLKYKKDYLCAEILSSFMAELIINKKIQFDIITFVPLSAKSLKKRAYNQSELLAKNIGVIMKKPIVPCTKKVRETQDQIGLESNNRWANLSDCFKVNSKYINTFKGKTILLIDDVITTGATTFYCAEQLKKYGAKDIYILTAAKSRI